MDAKARDHGDVRVDDLSPVLARSAEERWPAWVRLSLLLILGLAAWGLMLGVIWAVIRGLVWVGMVRG